MTGHDRAVESRKASVRAEPPRRVPPERLQVNRRAARGMPRSIHT